MKVNDVYSFQWNADAFNKTFEPYHCFDGQLIVKERDGELYFMDTYWASKYDGFAHWRDNRSLTVAAANAKGELKYICNLDEVEEIREGERAYYSDEDLFDLSYQHGCYQFFVKKKGAVKSAEKMERVIRERISQGEYQVERALRTIDHLKQDLEKVTAGDLNIHL